MLLIRFIDLFTFSHGGNWNHFDVACSPFNWPGGAWVWPCGVLKKSIHLKESEM